MLARPHEDCPCPVNRHQGPELDRRRPTMGAMRIDEIFASGDRPVFSFEFFPPQTPEGEANLYLALARAAPARPATSSASPTAPAARRAARRSRSSRASATSIGLEAMAHFTCVGATVDELRSTLDEMRALGFENVLALRGDPPQGQEEWTKTEGGLEYSRELVELISGDYPLLDRRGLLPRDAHPRDLARGRPALPQGEGRRRRRASSSRSSSSTTRSTSTSSPAPARSASRCRSCPGILPDHELRPARARDDACAARRSPTTCSPSCTQRRDDDEAVAEFGVAYATMQCADLLANGAPGHPLLHAQPLARRRARSSARCASGARGTASTPALGEPRRLPTPA